MRCPSCQICKINNIICHETNCPDSNLNLLTGLYTHECFECGCEIESECKSTWECNCNDISSL